MVLIKPSMEQVHEAAKKTLEKATFSAGCFWGVEAAFKKIPGVISTRVGYIGGDFEDPTYREVCAGSTGHVEAGEIIYDPEKVNYRELLELFWSIHDPTQPDGQGNDIGSQYMSIIFYHTPEQKRVALESKSQEAESRNYGDIVTRITEAGRFWSAEEYHQKYLEKNPGGYCHINMTRVDKKIAAILQKRHR